MLKKGLKGVTEEEAEQFLDKAIMLFRFVEDKDVFERYYKNHLAKRLLAKRSISDDTERNMIAKLKAECGYQFTSKLEGMFTDMRLSDDLMTSFKEYSNSHPTQVDLQVTVLTMTFWPLPSIPAKCNLPPEVLQSISVFQNFYYARHTGRRLTWQSSMVTISSFFLFFFFLLIQTYNLSNFTGECGCPGTVWEEDPRTQHLHHLHGPAHALQQY